MNHLLTIEDLTRDSVLELFKKTEHLKRTRGQALDRPLANKSVGMVFSKSSTRTRVSFEVGVNELGGQSLYLNANDLQLGRGETMADTARVLSRYLHAIIIRAHKHAEVEEFAKYSTIPVINALTDRFHPCQALTDVFTMFESAKRDTNIKLTYLGDGASNMANSLVLVAKLMGVDITVCSPEIYAPPADIIQRAQGIGSLSLETDPVKAVSQADFLYTDVWVSMGFEEEAEERLKILKPYQLNSTLLEQAPSHAKVLHCLPARRGLEITDTVMDGDQSIVFDQAENRLHVQKSILSSLV